MREFEFIVIGKGLWGGAAGRYLSEWGHDVALIGPDEPQDSQTLPNVYASHYDQGRLTRQLGRNEIYSAAALRAIAKYRLLEERSGINFYEPVGMVLADRGGVGLYTGHVQETAAKFDVAYQYHKAGNREWQEAFPFLDFPQNYNVLVEPAPAGYINPRAMVQAQLAIAQQQGAHIIAETVCGVVSDGDGVTVQTFEGEQYRAQRVLIAAGAFTNFCGLLPQPIPLRIKTETIILGEVSPATAASLKKMPTVIYDIDSSEIDDIYMAPPIKYPDGRFYIKMGCNTAADQWPTTLKAVQAWFREGDSDRHKQAMADAMQSQLPSVSFESIESKRCMVCYTPCGVPTIDTVGERLVVAAGGNGSGAKGSDTWGKLAAGLLVDGRWPDAFPRQPFLATNKWQ